MAQAKRKDDRVTPMSLDAILEGIPGGIPLVISHVRRLGFKDDKYAAWVRVYDEDTEGKLTLDDVCHQAKVDASDLLGDVVASAHRWGEHVVQLAHSAIAQQRASDVIERSYIEAAKPEGFADRNRLLQKHGVHPAPKGTVINMNQGVALQGSGLRPFEDETSELADILADDRLLAEGEENYIEVEDEEDLAFVEAPHGNTGSDD